jgi:hypothetical protein
MSLVHKDLKVAIAALTRGYPTFDGYNTLIQRTKAIELCIFDESDSLEAFDFLFFHEGNFSDAHQEQFRQLFPASAIHFISVSDYFYNHANHPKISEHCRPSPLADKFPFGYKCMCSFWLNGFLSYAANYDYIIRIDEDCILQHARLSAYIKEMQVTRSVYSSTSFKSVEPKEVTDGLHEFCTNFAARNKTRSMGEVPEYLPYTNFSIFDVKYYTRSSLFSRFCEEVHRSGCIFINRWGDLPLWGYYLMISHDTVFFPRDLIYKHGDKVVETSNSYLRVLIPKPAPFPLMRIGGSEDGAYLVPNDLEDIAHCFSPGVSNRKDFEDELSKKYDIKCHMCDYSSDINKLKTPLLDGLQTFEKKWLGSEADDHKITLKDWVAMHTDPLDDLMLQIDIEGAEYESLLGTPFDVLRRFRIIVIELHGLFALKNPGIQREQIIRLLKKLGQDHVCVHAHPNNCDGSFIDVESGLNIPSVIELTFLHKDRFEVCPETIEPMLPHPLDIRENVPSMPPLHLNEAWLDGRLRSNESRIVMLENELSYCSRENKQLKNQIGSLESALYTSSQSLSFISSLYESGQFAGSDSQEGELPGVELANGKTFYLSSSYTGSRVDGIVQTTEPFFFHTKVDINQSITIDLGSSHRLYWLQIANRTDKCHERAAGIYYIIHNQRQFNAKECIPVSLSKAFLEGRDNSMASTWLGKRIGRYLTVFSPHLTALHFSQICIYGEIVLR